MRNRDGRLVGILGTVIIHLIAAIIFMSFKLKSLDQPEKEQLILNFSNTEEPEILKKEIELPPTQIEKILKGDQEMLNIARNLSNKSEEKIDASDYIDKVKEELIKSGKLGTENYIDDQKKAGTKNSDEINSSENNKTSAEEKTNTEESQKIAGNYKGPTRIYYDLAGRNHMYLPIPIYLCQGSGKVMLDIEVNQQGDVLKAKIATSESTTIDPCLIETAVNTALMSRFNPDIKSPKIQNGTLTYIFVAQ
jgi:outer membrane biosynthesis protein TonB